MKSGDDVIATGIKRVIARGKERGYVTFDELNDALPADQASSKQIEDAMTVLSELGINVVEAVLRSKPKKGAVDYAKLSREHIARYPKIRARLAE